MSIIQEECAVLFGMKSAIGGHGNSRTDDQSRQTRNTLRQCKSMSEINAPRFTPECDLYSNYNCYQNRTRMAPNPQVIPQRFDPGCYMVKTFRTASAVEPLGWLGWMRATSQRLGGRGVDLWWLTQCSFL